MSNMLLLGTTTSPYTRKIRILAGEIGLPVELLDTRTEAGAARLREVAPLGKVPVLLPDAHTVVPDSTLIVAWLWDRFAPRLSAAGWDLRPFDFVDQSDRVVIEGGMDAAINRFYLRQAGFEDRGYVAKQRDRSETVLAWADRRARFIRPRTHAGLSLGCWLDWLDFRAVVRLDRFAGLLAYRTEWSAAGIGRGSEPS